MAGHECGLMDAVTSDPKIEGLNPFVVFGGAVFLKIISQVTEVMNGVVTVSLKESNNSLFAVQSSKCRSTASVPHWYIAHQEPSVSRGRDIHGL